MGPPGATATGGRWPSYDLVMHVLEREVVVPAPRDRVFPFFADARNLERLTPPALRFRILTPGTIEMRPGAVIEYRLSLTGVPFRWRTVIERWEPPTLFVDFQDKGPYKLWRHTHSFEEVAGGTLMRDRVEYELPFGPLGAVAHRLFVARQLDEIFAFRGRVVRAVFAT
jgi:ligand-binding SRPBCC domain-containing protein